MAKSEPNALSTLHGRIGNLVYSLQKDGSVVVRHQPVRKRQESSPAQKAQQERFRKAILYARGVLKILELSAMYESAARKRGTLARELAMTDYLSPPRIEDDLTAYSGIAGEPIERTAGKLRRVYGGAQTPLARVLASAQVSLQTKRRLTQEKALLNPH